MVGGVWGRVVVAVVVVVVVVVVVARPQTGDNSQWDRSRGRRGRGVRCVSAAHAPDFGSRFPLPTDAPPRELQLTLQVPVGWDPEVLGRDPHSRARASVSMPSRTNPHLPRTNARAHEGAEGQ